MPRYGSGLVHNLQAQKYAMQDVITINPTAVVVKSKAVGKDLSIPYCNFAVRGPPQTIFSMNYAVLVRELSIYLARL